MTSIIGDLLAPLNSDLTETGREKALFITGILSDVFGINGLVYLPGTEKESKTAGGYYGIEILPEDEAEQMSSLGTPVVGTVKFLAGEYTMYDSASRVIKKTMGDFILPYSCLVEFSRAANITTTNTLGGTGSVKEIYGLDDWKIDIRGIALNDPASGSSAHRIINELVQWRKICDSIKVEGSLFSNKEIYSLVIEEVSIQPIEAKYNVIPFQISAISDEPIELQLP